MIAIFARSNHPQGYGFGHKDGQPGGAHGYVVVGIRCRNQKQVQAVWKHIQEEGFDLPDDGRIIYPEGKPESRYARTVNMYGSRKDEKPVIRWYSGGPSDWDYLFTVRGNQIEWPWPTHAQYGSRGDNRFTMVYDAKEVLG